MIAKHGKTYWLDVRVRGRRVRRSLGTDEHGLALDRARVIRDKLIADAGRGDITFPDIITKYKDWARLQKPASVRTERYQLDWLLAYAKRRGIAYLADWTPLLIEEMRTEIRARKIGKETKRTPTPATVNRYTQLLRSIFYRASDWSLYSGENPVRKVRFLKERPAVPVLEPGQVAQVLKTAETISRAKYASPAQRAFSDLCILALNTGMRKAEMLRLRWRDIRDDVAAVQGKGDKRREVPLNATARAVIFRQPRDGEFVFPIPNRHQPDLFARTYRLMTKRLGRPFYLHLLRHRFTTALLERGVDIVTLSDILGHSKSMTTLIYTHTDPDRKRAAVGTLDGQSTTDVSRATRRK